MIYEDKTVMVIDNGFFCHVAERLTSFFGKVLYFSPWVSSLPEMERGDVGRGFPGVTRVLSIFDHINEVDLFVFPDLFYADLQAYLRKQGKRVWGTGGAEWMELDRWRMRVKMKELSMPCPSTRPVTGLDDLKKILQKEKDLFVKPSFWRGATETFHHSEWFMTEPLIEELEHKLGVRKSDIKFIVEKNLGDAVEVGYDGYTIDGQYPDKSLYGFEVKDCGYVGKFVDNKELPNQILYVNKKMASIFAQEKSRGFYSNEIRVGEDSKPYLIDPTIRMPSPPGELYAQAYENFGEILYEGADGNLVSPVTSHKYGALAIVYSKCSDSDWIAMQIDDNVRDFVKLKQHMMSDGKDYIVPLHIGLNEVGVVIGFGSTVDKAIKEVEKHAEGVRGYGLTIKTESLQDAKKVIDRAHGQGLDF